MNVMVLDKSDSVEVLREVAKEWAASAHGIDFGVTIDVNIGLATMQRLVNNDNSDVLVLVSNGEIKGFMGLIYHNNHIGPGKIANECCFYVETSSRGGGLKLIHAAEKIAKMNGCDFVTLNASKIAGDSGRSGKLYEHCGYKSFESSYLRAL